MAVHLEIVTPSDDPMEHVCDVILPDNIEHSSNHENFMSSTFEEIVTPIDDPMEHVCTVISPDSSGCIYHWELIHRLAHLL